MTPPRVHRIARITLHVRDLPRMTAFYVDALGFTLGRPDPARTVLTLGAQEIELLAMPNAAPYPVPRAANDPWFQHFAIAVSDMPAAYARLARFAPEPITRDGPQLLPPATGSVTAYKFRDPEGHPLELSHAPGSAWARAAGHQPLFQGIDHTALATRDLRTGVAFYTALGLREGPRLLNQGPEQARLDGLDGATLDIATLLLPGGGPHIELLHYRTPKPPPARAVGPVAATCTVLELTQGAAPGDPTDPDGHALRFTTQTPAPQEGTPHDAV